MLHQFSCLLLFWRYNFGLRLKSQCHIVKWLKLPCYTAINDGMEFLFPLRRIFHIVHTKEEIYLLFNMEATVVIVYMFIEFHGRCWKSQLP